MHFEACRTLLLSASNKALDLQVEIVCMVQTEQTAQSSLGFASAGFAKNLEYKIRGLSDSLLSLSSLG